MASTLGYIEDVEQFARLPQLKKAIEEVRPLIEKTMNIVLKSNSRRETGECLQLKMLLTYMISSHRDSDPLNAISQG
jgi:hypothetical protein